MTARVLVVVGAVVTALSALALPVAAGGGASVTASGMSFTPSSVNIDPGESVTWTAGSNNHTVTFNDGSFNSHPACTGSASTCFSSGDPNIVRAFPSAGVFAYHCNVHDNMDGTVRVGQSTTTKPPTTTTKPPTTTTKPPTTTTTMATTSSSVDDSTSTSDESTTSSSATTTTTTEDDTDTTDDDELAGPAVTITDEDDDGGGGSGLGVAAVGLVLGLALLGGGMFAMRRRASPYEEYEDDESFDDEPYDDDE